MSEVDLREQLEAVQRGLRRSGRAMVLSGAQAVVRGACVVAGTGATYALGGRPWWWIAAVWGGVVAVAVAAESVMYVRLSRADPDAFVTGIERQLLKFLALLGASGVALTVALVAAESSGLLPGTWMLLVGLGYAAVGLFSFSRTWIMGVCAMAGGAIALFAAPLHALAMLGAIVGVGSMAWGAVAMRSERDGE